MGEPRWRRISWCDARWLHVCCVRIRSRRRFQVLLGESAVGKSSIVLRFMKDAFSDHIDSTIGGEWAAQGARLCARLLTRTLR